MDTQDSTIPPAPDQRARAQEAHLNPNDPAKDAQKPEYGTFGHADDADFTASSAGRSGANDNPDEFSEFSDRRKDANNAPDNPEDQPGHVEQNQDPEAVRAAQGEEDDIQRKAWALDDPRYAGGGTHNTRDEPADANYPKKDE